MAFNIAACQATVHKRCHENVLTKCPGSAVDSRETKVTVFPVIHVSPTPHFKPRASFMLANGHCHLITASSHNSCLCIIKVALCTHRCRIKNWFPKIFVHDVCYYVNLSTFLQCKIHTTLGQLLNH